MLAHGGSVYWNDVSPALGDDRGGVVGGTSMLGEVWYAEADTPVGPWVYARKVVTHDRYSFYNPKQHPMFDKEGGRMIFFEGTYTHTFSGNPTRRRATTTTRSCISSTCPIRVWLCRSRSIETVGRSADPRGSRGPQGLAK